MIPTSFSSLIGNEPIKLYLQRMLEKKAIGNSLLFAGQEGIGKGLFAYVFAAQLMGEQHRSKIEKGQHPDIHIYRPEGKLGLHSIQSLRLLSEEVYLPPYEADWKVFIVHEAERMLTYSANALLKTFEEPPPRTVIILLSQSQAALLPTIVSRCRTLHFKPISQYDIEQRLAQSTDLSVDAIRSVAGLAHGSLGRALHLAYKGGDPTRLHLLDTLSNLPLANYKMLGAAVERIVEEIESSRKHAEDSAKEELVKASGEYLSAAQQNSLEKEIEGFSTLAFVQDAQALFNQLLAWYRDLHLLQLTQNRSYLINRDYAEQLEQVVQRGNLMPIEKVQKAIDEAQLALQRSTSLNICLENLFLKLGWV